MPQIRPFAPSGAIRLRTLLGTLVLGAWLYAGGFSAYLAFTVWPTAQELGRGMRTMASMDRELGRRHDALDRTEKTLSLAAHPPTDEPVDSGALSEGRLGVLQERIREQMRRSPAPAFAELPPHLGVGFARAEQAMADWGALLAELIAHLRLGHGEEARRTYHRAQELHSRVDSLHTRARAQGRDELLGRQDRMEATATRASRIGLLWMGGGFLFLPLVFVLFRRRVESPLAELERALDRVREGDLSARAPLLRRDEFGRLALHFNRVTRVLQRRAEEQGRYAAAGELLASIAHEVNNPLMAISSIAENRLDASDPLSDSDRSDLQEIRRQARRAGALLKGLLRFLRPADDPRAEADVNDTVRETVQLIAYHFRVREVEPRLSLEADLPSTTLHPDRLEQVVVNLLSNAVDAVRTVDPPRWIAVETSRLPDGMICLAVEDNGPGVPKDARDEIFRPFVTTKGEEGTGLGLYISREIVRESGGDLVCRAGEAGGARFEVRLPSGSPRERGATTVREDEAELEGLLPDAGPSSLAGLRILLVDDERPIRRALTRFLVRSGATVHAAEDGMEALTLLDRFPVDVVVADLRMPRMDGLELFRRIRSEHPALVRRVLFLTGDLQELDEELETGSSLARDRILSKPVDLGELARRIGRTAAGRAG